MTDLVSVIQEKSLASLPTLFIYWFRETVACENAYLVGILL